MNTIDRILELVNESGLTAKEFAENANIAGGSITDWKTGRSKPSVESLQKISKYTGVQLDWLTGDSEFKTKDQELDGFLKNKNSILILKTIHRYYYEFVVPCKLKEKDIDNRFGSFTKFPDLILMDGGKGQVNIALQVLEELHLNIPVCGMVKDDNHRTRGLYYNNQEIPIDRQSEGFKLITRIQDEAHRFAIEYHRSLRSKEQVHSVLDDIPGVGPTRRKALMKAFSNIGDIKDASVEELEKIPNIPRNIAEEIYSFFHSSVVR